VDPTEDERRSRLASTAGRLAFLPARAAVRASRDQLDDVLVPELVRLIDKALAGPLPEEVVRSAERHRVVDRVMKELASSGALDRAVRDALNSDQMRLAIREIVESPEVRAALTQQTTGLAGDVVESIRTRAQELDDRLQAGRRRSVPSPFAGIATRAAALAIDAGAITFIFVSLSALVSLISSLVGTLRPQWLVGLLLAAGFSLIAATYLVVFWSGAGQTPGMRLLHLRVVGHRGGPPSFARSVLRTIGTAIAIIPLFAGYLPVLFDRRRRGLPDYLARTVVVYEDPTAAANADSSVPGDEPPRPEL
jgi:uncharacterized RDD family membrane protein YckC